MEPRQPWIGLTAGAQTVLMDYQMLRLDVVFMATRQLRQHGYAGQIIALTADAFAESTAMLCSRYAGRRHCQSL